MTGQDYLKGQDFPEQTVKTHFVCLAKKLLRRLQDKAANSLPGLFQNIIRFSVELISRLLPNA